MKISELIEKLAELQAQHGDVEVVLESPPAQPYMDMTLDHIEGMEDRVRIVADRQFGLE